MAGVEGNGQNDLVACILGRRNASMGTIEVDGQPIMNLSIRQLRDRHISYIPEDRMTFGAVTDFNIEENLISDKYDQPEYSGSVFLKRENIKKYSAQMVQEFGVVCKSSKQQLGMLSGGNMQKVIAAREFSSEPSLLIAEQPTRGIDVGAARIIHEKLLDMRSKGCAILLISADINEILAISDRVIVMFNGRIVGCFDDIPSLTEQEMGLYMLGVKQTSFEVKEQSHA
jgi:simple sugar transport system ATP-binding protein